MICNISDRRPRGNHAKPHIEEAGPRKNAPGGRPRQRSACRPAEYQAVSTHPEPIRFQRCATSFASLSTFSQPLKAVRTNINIQTS